jgi:hypothetical protein
MTEKEIEKIMDMPIDDLFELAQNRQLFPTVLSLAIRKGIKQGNIDVLNSYNQMFKGYNAVSIAN